MTNDEPVWFETDTDREGVDGLEMAVEQLRHVLEDVYRWKWVILATHNALTCLMCVAVQGSNKLGAMQDRYVKAWNEAYERHERLSSEQEEKLGYLVDFMELFKRVQGPPMTQFGHSRRLRPTSDQRDAVRSLNYWRRQFTHYKPLSLSIEVRGYPDIVEECFGVAEFLALESGNVFWGDDPLIERTRRALEEGRRILAEIKQLYGE